MRRLPPLNSLRAFEAAARHGSFKAAAEELHVTPTAVSHQIRQLESLLEQPLFRRRPRQIRLTPAGQKLFPFLREGFDRIDAGVAALRNPAVSRPVVITTTTAFASRWLVPRLDALRRACGGCDFAVEASEKVLRLHAGEADLAIRYSYAPDPEMECEALITDRYLPVASPALLERDPHSRSPADLFRHPLIHFEWKQEDPLAPGWNRWLGEMRRRFPDESFPPVNGELRLSEETHAIEAAVEGQGVALLSDFIIARELRHGLLVPASEFAIEGLTFYAVYQGESARRDFVEKAVAYIRSEITKLQ